MTKLDRNRVREYLERLDLKSLFIEELGWDRGGENVKVSVAGADYDLNAVAHKRGMVAYQYLGASAATFPNHPTRQKIERALAKTVREHLIIYVPPDRHTQYWQWVKREPGRPDRSRQHIYQRGQSGEALVQRLENLAFTLDEEEDLTIVDVSGRVRAAFDVERVTKRFFERFAAEHKGFLRFIEGISGIADREWYASLMLNRMMFIYFIQKRGFLDGDTDYLRHRLERLQREQGANQFQRFYRLFLLRLFHEGLAQPQSQRAPELAQLLGRVPYLNGGLFDVHDLERQNPEIRIPDAAFEKIFAFFDAYQWHLDDRPLHDDKEINPDVLGYIFEKYVNQKQMGAYYTKEDITGYISRNTIVPLLLEKAEKECPIAFGPTGGVWRLLRDDPDRYFFEPVRQGITYDLANKEDLPNPRELPDEIKAGIDDFNKREKFDKAASKEYALSSETWREHIARRQRYEDIRSKLVRGEVSSVNDLVTYNLDLEKFLQDVIAQSEGPELIRALWKAVTSISVLDPTCGSGAFLFAALNVLEPVYVACLQAMRGFLDDLDHSGRKHHAETMSDFRNELERVARHASERYFILKEIIISNLYGVDIMEEAVEICKLRLFLKLVAQLERYDQIEPLPDIDFNIRPGNTLIGFASLHEVKRSLSTDMVKQLALPEIEARADAADAAFRRFRDLQIDPDDDPRALSDAKQGLRQRLTDLRNELDSYLARECGVSDIKSKAFKKWCEDNQPFHWFVEFYGIMHTGGFDAILGNPPYIEIPQTFSRQLLSTVFRTALERWSRDEDVYTLVVERSLQILNERGGFGMILPLSIAFSTKQPFIRLRQRLTAQNGDWWLSHFDRIPSALFGNEVRTRCTIAILIRNRAAPDKSLRTSSLQRWETQDRQYLFPALAYGEIDIDIEPGVPKLPTDIQGAALGRLLEMNKPLSNDLNSSVSFTQLAQSAPNFPPHCVFVGGTAYNWFPAWREIPETTTESGAPSLPARTIGFRFDDDATADAVFALLCSSLGYWWWAVASDGFNLKKWLVQRFPVSLSMLPSSNRRKLSKLGASLRKELAGHYVYKDNKGRIGNFYLPACAGTIAEIDRELSTALPWLTGGFFDDVKRFNQGFSRATHDEAGEEDVVADD
jgi:hypothetical protein